MDNPVVQHFEFASAFQGFHVYKNTENWRLVKGQKLTFIVSSIVISTDLL